MKDLVNLVPEAFFDFFSYFLPGLFLVLMAALNINLCTFFPEKATFGTWQVVLYLVVAYILGHLLTTVSELLILRPMNYLLGDPANSLIGIGKAKISRFQAVLDPSLISNITDIVTRKFKTNIDQHTFFLCENYVRASRPDIGFLVRKRHAFEHLCRNLVVASIALMILMAHTAWQNQVLLALVLVVFFIRYLDYRVSWPKAVFENFYLLTVEDNKQESHG